ncbi:hypothetical protein KZ376_04400 [Glaesserella parasuis]|nr:hypothetical protein [Glaesserella parasuis]
MKIEFPATTGANPIVEGDKVTINYTPENTDGTAGTPTTLTYTYTNGEWKQEPTDTLQLPTEKGANNVVSVKLPEDKVADNTEVKAQTTDVSGKTSAESNTTKVVAPFDEKSAQPTITVKAVDVVSNGEAANNEPEKAIVTVDTTKNGQKAPKGSFVKVYKEGELNTSIGEGVIDENGKAVITITENTNGAPQDIKSTDSLVATVQEVGTDGTTPVKAPSIPSTAVQVGTPAIGKHDANNPQSGGHEGDETAPTTAPTLEALTDDTNLGAVKVKLPEDAKDGDRVIVTFTPETPENAQQVSVTLTKGANGWTSDKPELIPAPTNGSNEVTIAKDKVANNTEVTAVIKDLADNTTAASPNATAYPNERTPLRSVTLEKAIDTDTASNATREKFTIKGTAEKDATVTATITLPSGEKVVIGTFKVTEENGSFSFDTTDIKKDETLKAKLTNFTFNTENGQATQITVEATKEGKAPSHAQTVNAKAAAKGVKEDHTETTAPDNPTITPYMEGFGGAKITLPTPQSGELLEVKVTVTPKAENGQDTQPAKEVTLTYNRTTWSLPNNDSSNLGLTLKKDGDKNVVILSGDKVPYGGTIAATTTDFAGNKPEAVTQNLNKGPTDETAKEPDYSKDRTDVPTIKAGRTEGTGTNSDQPNAGDIVAKPGGDNDRMVVKYKDEDGNAKEIAIKKDLDQGKWVVDDTATLSNGAQKADRSDYILQDDGTVIVKGPQVQDGSEAEAVGYKGGKASTDPYVDGKNSDGTWKQESELIKDSVTNQPLTRETKAIITTHKDDATPTQTDKPTVSKGDMSTLEKGSAKIKPGPDNTEVVVNFQGYARTVTETPNSATGTEQAQPTTRKAITTEAVQAGNNADPIYTGAQNTFATEEVDAVLVPRKENGEWKLYSATKEDYEHKETGTDGQQHPSPRNLSPVSDDVATIDKDGNIILKAAAVKDNSQVSATGFNAMKSPATGEKDTDNITVDPGLTADKVKNKTVDVSTIEQLNDGSVVAKPGQDNKEMTTTYTAPNGEQKTIKVKETTISDSNAPTGSTKWVVEGQNPDNLEVNPTTGAITIPKDKVKVDEKVNATGKDEQNNEAKAEELTVKADATPESAEAAKVTTEGDKVVSEPGGDSKTQTVNEVDADGIETPIVVAEKDENGKWKLADSDPNTGKSQEQGNTITITKDDGSKITLDKDTGKITIDPGVVSDGKSISTETADASGNTTSSGEPVVPPKKETSTDRAKKPIITPLNDGENKGGVQIQPGSDNTTFTVSYVKEPETTEGNTNADAATRAQDSTLTAVKDKQTGKWSFSETVASDVAEINAEDGTITLKAKAVMDGSTVKATGTDILNNSANAEDKQAPNNPDVVAPEAQPKPPRVEAEPETPPSPPDDSQTSADQLDTPTLFQNTNTGEVKVTPGTNVDFISFTAAINGQTQNFAFIKDAQGQWEKYVMKVNGGDIDNNGVLSGTETIEYEPVDSNIGSPPFTIQNITSDKLTNITVGRAGDEYLTVTQDQAVQDNMDIGGKGAHTVHEFKVKKADSTEAVPEKMHVLSNGEELVAPIIQAQHDSTAQKYRVKVIADPTKLSAIQFNIDANGNDNVFSLKSNGTNWSYYNYWTDNGNYNDGPNKTLVKQGEANNIIYIEDVGSNKTFHINNDLEISRWFRRY